jgi:hypothetical protein
MTASPVLGRDRTRPQTCRGLQQPRLALGHLSRREVPRWQEGRRVGHPGLRVDRLEGAYHLDTLATAYAECGDFAHAVEYQEKAQGLYKDEKDREKGRDRLALYREKKPYRDVPEAK